MGATSRLIQPERSLPTWQTVALVGYHPRIPAAHGALAPMTLEHISARIRWLEKLWEGLTRETGIIKHQANPLLPRERQDYGLALENAIAGLRVAHQVLAQARQRMTG